MTSGNFMLYYLRDGRNKSALSRFTSKGAIISRLLSFFRKRRLLYESKTFEIVVSHPSLRALFRARGKAGAWADKEIVCNCNVCKRLPHPNGARLWRITILRTRRFPTVFLRSGFFYTRTPTENSVGISCRYQFLKFFVYHVKNRLFLSFCVLVSFIRSAPIVRNTAYNVIRLLDHPLISITNSEL